MLPSRYAYDDLDHLAAELDQEKRYRETIAWSNADMERSVAELETYVHELEQNVKGAEDNEWRVRFESQTALNKQLQEHREWLESELSEARRKFTTGSYPEALNFNLDALNEPELLRLVKHLERMRNDLYSNLRDTEWKLDKESKEFHHLDEMRRVYKADLKHANQTIDRMRLTHVLDPSGLVSLNPLYPPGYLRWLDTHPPPANTKKGATGTKKAGAAGTSSQRKARSQSPPPPRSKSRNDKTRPKKKEPEPESELDNATDVSGSGGEQLLEKSNGDSGSGDSYVNVKEAATSTSKSKRDKAHAHSHRDRDRV